MPNDFQAGGIRQGDMLVHHDTDRQINVVQWRDKRDVFLLTMTEQPAMEHVPARRPGAPPVERPNVIHTYNHGKDGVDQNDQLCSYYSMERKSMKWYKRVFWRLIGIAMVNAYIVFKKTTGPHITHIAFLKDAIRSLVIAGQLPEPLQQHPGQPQQHQQALRLLPGNHFPEHHPSAQTRQNPCKVCVVCSHVKLKELRYRCELCQVSLCIAPCFKLYHKNKDFRQAFNIIHRGEE